MYGTSMKCGREGALGLLGRLLVPLLSDGRRVTINKWWRNLHTRHLVKVTDVFMDLDVGYAGTTFVRYVADDRGGPFELAHKDFLASFEEVEEPPP